MKPTYQTMKRRKQLYLITFFFLLAGQKTAFSNTFFQAGTHFNHQPTKLHFNRLEISQNDTTPLSPSKTQLKNLKKQLLSPLSSKNKEKLILFQWLNEQHFSLQWAYGFFRQKHTPPLLKVNINDTFLNQALFFFNFQQNIIQFPYILKWGLKVSTGITRNYDNDKIYFYPLHLSAITSLQIFKYQLIVPFFEMGYSTWNIDFSEFSEAFPVWSLGASVSWALFKQSLSYTLPDEYGIQDAGISLEIRNHSSSLDMPERDRGYFLRSIHVGIYFKF